MLDFIISLLIAIGAYLPGKTNKPIVVIDQSTGISYGIGSVTGTGNSISGGTVDTYILVKDSRGNYKLVKI